MLTEIEIKLARKIKLKSLQEKGKSQIIGHVFKYLYHHFHLFGIGMINTSLGILLVTPVSIEVIEMRLSGVGTENVKQEIVSTECIPLLKILDLHHAHEVNQETGYNGFIIVAGAFLMRNMENQNDHENKI
jgi:hypothetical protein